MGLMRLDRFLSSQKGISRKDATLLVKHGQVEVDGHAVSDAGQKIDPHTVRVMLSGRRITFKKHIYLMMNKPAGVISASRDPKQRTVIDLIPAELMRKGLFPAGRLDKDTEGLLLLTDDGDFAHRLLSPKNRVIKTYLAAVSHPVGEAEIAAFAFGIQLADGTVLLPAELRVIKNGDKPLVEVRICEGKYHQVKRMFGALGMDVLSLKRIAIGALTLDETLLPGRCKELSREEIELAEQKVPLP